MVKKTTKRIENFHFNLFKESYSKFPNGTIEQLDDNLEGPDFLIHTKSGILGIEHTRIFQKAIAKSPLQAIESTQNRILKKAKILCVEKDIPPLSVEVIFNNKKIFKNSNLETINFSRTEIDDLSNKLSTTIIKYYNQNLNAKESIGPTKLNCKIEGIDSVYVTIVIPHGEQILEHHRWQSIKIGLLRQNFIQDIQKCISEKNIKLCKYLEKCQECWLLIVADRSKPSQCFQINQTTRQHFYESSFNTVFYFEIMEKELVQLKCSKQNKVTEQNA